ncbi:Eco57I restriction-modification methylase domain-containing protein [Draconibacterium halophilum]|uniref:site-specific DNA-methyltransferase (adenine-specific) n=1 Tax=Draconibacterium halophilum TaxID=2706887 RepID=A0A6C0RFC7_9BACT|nr:N-6 DNA methylase [Draconibacterium halophilum]QIA08849.1 N-6 DNA methylase [Draconibacterium halophilum]
MSLFQKSVEKKYLNDLDTAVIDKKYADFLKHFGNPEIQENIRNSKEEQYQGEFLIDLFVNILGYTKNPTPNFNLTTELKNISNSKKADGAILKGDDATAVIELKGTGTTDLDKIETQAFGYKNHHPKCKYVITSNFEKLRFYIQNAVDHVDFDLFNLTREQFSLLWLCLAKDNLLNDLPLKIKESSVLQEENITKKLYADYSKFREAIYTNLVKNNPETDKLLLFKKTQKLLDRFLFIFFAEDRLLLPPNSISEIVKQWADLKEKYDEYFPLYSRFKKYFGYMNTGYNGKKYDIYAYNGGLFKPDEVLDNITIDDDILYEHTLRLSNYDFETDVDVNILGHIFEHSLGEIENVQAEIKGEKIDSQKTKRKKDGIFYTPKYITKYIVENTVGKLCNEKRTELGIVDEEYAKGRKNRKKEIVRTLDKKLDDYRNWLLTLTILDPACGSGAFLNQALEFLINEHRKIDELRGQLLGGAIIFSDITTDILEKNIYGVDLNEESVEIAKLSLWLRTAQKGRKLNTLSNNIKCGNSLIDDPEIAGEKAFNWQNEFPDIFKNGGFDVVIGNPPYVFAREKISENEKEHYSKNYNSADYQVNTYLLFIEKTVEIIKPKAIFGLIVPNAWLMVYSGQGLRKYLLEHCKLNQIINLEGYSFEGVNVETIIILSQKERIENNDFQVLLNKGKEFVYSHSRNQQDFTKNTGSEFKVFLDDESISLTRKLISGSVDLDSIVQIKAGLQAYEKGKGNPKQSAEDVKNRPYDYNCKFDESTYKYLDGKDVGRYFIEWSGLYLKYGEHLAAPRTFNLFSDKKIIVREITGNYPQCIISTFSEDLYLYNRSNIAIIEREGKNINLKYIVAVLNSTLMSYYFMKNTAKSVRKMFPKVILKDLRLFPFKEIDENLQIPFITNVEKIQYLHKEFFDIRKSFIDLLKSKIDLEKFTNKLLIWYEQDFKTFLGELTKAKIKLNLSEEAEWMQYFNEQKEKAQTIKSEIEKTDKEIDRMVFELYGLTEEEIKIVENS